MQKPCPMKLFELENGEWYIQQPSQNGYLMQVDADKAKEITKIKEE